MFRSAFPDLNVTVEDLVAEGNKVAARWSWGGTHRGELMGIPPTSKQVAASGTSIHRIAEGKIVESWFNFDGTGTDAAARRRSDALVKPHSQPRPAAWY